MKFIIEILDPVSELKYNIRHKKICFSALLFSWMMSLNGGHLLKPVGFSPLSQDSAIEKDKYLTPAQNLKTTRSSHIVLNIVDTSHHGS